MVAYRDPALARAVMATTPSPTSPVEPSRWAPDAGDRPSLLAPSLRRRIIDVLAAAPLGADGRTHGAPAQDVATMLDIHVTTARSHLEALVDAHVVEATTERRGRVGRPRKLYRLVPASLRLDPTHRELSRLVTSHWGLADGPERMFPAARDWAYSRAVVEVETTGCHGGRADTPGRWLSRVEEAVALMEPWGFRYDIALADGGRRVDLTLTAAPFLAIAARHAPVLYAFRRGLVTGVLEALGETDTDIDITPLDDPAVTTTHVSTTTPFRHTVSTPAETPAAVTGSTARTTHPSPRRTTNRRRDA